MTIYEDLKTQLNKKGIDVINVGYYDMIDVWKSWYAGSVNDFHFYDVRKENHVDGKKKCRRYDET